MMPKKMQQITNAHRWKFIIVDRMANVYVEICGKANKCLYKENIQKVTKKKHLV